MTPATDGGVAGRLRLLARPASRSSSGSWARACRRRATAAGRRVRGIAVSCGPGRPCRHDDAATRCRTSRSRYAPMLQAAGAPGLLGQWAAAMPPSRHAATMPGGRSAAARGSFNPWAAAMPFLPWPASRRPPARRRRVERCSIPGRRRCRSSPARSAPMPRVQQRPPRWNVAPWIASAVVPAPRRSAAATHRAARQAAWRRCRRCSRRGAISARAWPERRRSPSPPAFDRTFGALIDALGFGPMRKLQAAWQDLARRADGAEPGARRVRDARAGRVRGRTRRPVASGLPTWREEGERVDSVLALLRLWAVSTEAGRARGAAIRAGLAATAALSRARASPIAATCSTCRGHHRGCARHGDAPRSRRGLSRDPGAEARTARAARRRRPQSARPRKPRARATRRRRRNDEPDRTGHARVARAQRGRRSRRRRSRKELDVARATRSRADLRRLAEISDDDLAIATVPRDEVWREDMVRLYRCKPVVDKPHRGADPDHVRAGRAASR